MEGKYIVGITGGSGSGKTSFLKALRDKFSENEICIVSQDNYYKPVELQPKDENGEVNFDLPECIDHVRFANDIVDLSSEKCITKKEYVFQNTNKEPEIIVLKPAPIIVVEGLFVFHFADVSSQMNLKIYIETDDDIQLERRLKRDLMERGISNEIVLYQWKNHVLPMYENYLKPYREHADMIFINNKHFKNSFEVLCNHFKTILN